MKLLRLCLVFLIVSLSCKLSAAQLKSVDNFQTAATRANRALTIPDWEETPEALTASVVDTIARGNAALDEIGSQSLEYTTFETTILALENARTEATLVANRAALISETYPDPAMRAVAESALKKFQEWNVAIDYREDVYKAIKAFAATRPKLSGENERLFKETLRDYRRAGMELPSQEHKEIARMRNELLRLATAFDNNLFAANKPIVFTKAELDGVPEDFLSSPGIKLDNDRYQVMASVMWQYNVVEENARSETTRKKLYLAHDSIAKNENVPVINAILALRNRIALGLGYKSWADYQAEVRMAKTAAAAQSYIDSLVAGIQPKFAAELGELQQMKAADANEPNAKINVWDWHYYTNQLTKQKFSVDKEALRAFFSFQQTLNRTFAIFSRVFGLRFDEIKPPFKWSDELRLYVVSDSASKTPLGLLYLDLFARDGKTAGGGESEIVSGRLLADEKYQAPVAALVLSFPPASEGKPSLLSHSDVEILFHELGHALHCILTRAKFTRFAGTHVPVDFVEAPSQMLQNWIWDKRVLDLFADYRDPTKKIPADVIKKVNEAKMATAGMFYRRQFAFADLDLALHGPHPPNQPYDCLAISKPILERVFLPIDPKTAFVASFRGFNGYDAGYYGYAWSDAIAADMATIFEKAGYFNKRAGMKLRREIYEPGDSHDVTLSIQKFLRRKQSVEPFLKKLGIQHR